jgi:hypothetical protein
MATKRKHSAIRHIGNIFAICSKKISNLSDVRYSSLREDLEYDRYKGLGVTELFKNEKPYRICKKCLAIILKRENAFNKLHGRKLTEK